MIKGYQAEYYIKSSREEKGWKGDWLSQNSSIKEEAPNRPVVASSGRESMVPPQVCAPHVKSRNISSKVFLLGNLIIF